MHSIQIQRLYAKPTVKFRNPFVFLLLLLSLYLGTAGAGTALFAESWAEPQLVQEVLDGKRTEALASWWGFDAEDSTRFLQAALDSGVKKLTVDRQASDWIVCPLNGSSNIEIVLEDGVVILAKKGEFLPKAAALLRFSQCENVVIRGEKPGAKAALRMRKADYQKAPYEPAEWRHGLAILSSKNILVQDLTIDYSGGDGIYLGISKRGVTNSGVTIRRVDCNENHRQGISVISARDLLIEDSILRNTNGTAPQAGIDFEPNHDSEELTNCVMRRCVCEGNAGDGYEFYLPNLSKENSPNLSIVLEDCVSRKNGRNGIAWVLSKARKGKIYEPAHGTFQVKNFVTENESGHGISIQSNLINSIQISFENVEIRNCGQKNPTLPSINFASNMDALRSMGDISFAKVRIVEENAERPFFNFQDNSLEAWGLENVQGEIVCEKGGKKEVHVLNDEWIQKNYPIKNTHRLRTKTFEVNALALLDSAAAEARTAQGEVKLSFMRMRNHAKYLFWVKKGERLAFALKHCKVGKQSANPQKIQLTAPNGKNVPLAKLPFMETAHYELTADQTGIYVLECGPTSHSYVLEKTSVPVAIDTSRVGFISASGSLYFYVPEGTKDFGVCVAGTGSEMVKAAVFAPNGEKRWEKDGISSTEFFYPNPKEAEAGGIWRVEFSKPTDAVFEDFTFRIQNLTPVTSFCPEFLLIEK